MNDIESKTELPLVSVSTKAKPKKTLKKAKTVTKTKNKVTSVKKNTVKVVLSKIILDKLLMKTAAFIAMLKSKRVASENYSNGAAQTKARFTFSYSRHSEKKNYSSKQAR